MKDAIYIILMIIVVVFFFAILSASMNINSYYKPSIDDSDDEPEYDDNGIAK